MIEVVKAYGLLVDGSGKERLNALIEDGYSLWATLPGWAATDEFMQDTALVLYKPDCKDEQPPAPQVDTNSLQDFKGMVREGNYLVLDTETTGLHDGEICQISIIDSWGEVLLDTLVKTTQHIPDDATRIHGITNDMVADAPTWAEVQPRVRKILRGWNVVIYNATYDRKMMHKSDERAGLERTDYKAEATYWDAMTLYAEHYGEWNDYHGNYRWQKLSNAAAQCGIAVRDEHTALGDCRMTMGVINAMAAAE